MKGEFQKLVQADTLAGQDFSEIPAPKLDDFRAELRDFLGAGDRPSPPIAGVYFGGGRGLSPLSRPELEKAHTAIRRVLNAAVSGVELDASDLSLGLGILRVGPRAVPAVLSGSAADRCVLALMLLFGTLGIDRVRRCPECKEAFVKTGRRKYCRRSECLAKRDAEYWQDVAHKYSRQERQRRAAGRKKRQ